VQKDVFLPEALFLTGFQRGRHGYVNSAGVGTAVQDVLFDVFL
jgi:hypothetical protein